MAGRSSRVQARAYKHNQARKKQEQVLKNLEVNANLYRVLEGAGRPPTSGRYSGRGQSPRGGSSGWGFDGYVISRDRSGERWGQRWFYQYQKGVPNVTIGRRTYGPGRVDAKIYYEGEDDWKRKINAAYWAGQGMQDSIQKQKEKMAGWKPFDPSTVGSSRNMGGSKLGSSSTVVSVGGGYARKDAVVAKATTNVKAFEGKSLDQITAVLEDTKFKGTNVLKFDTGESSQTFDKATQKRIESGELTVGKDSSGNLVAVKTSSTEASKAGVTGQREYGEGFSDGFKGEKRKLQELGLGSYVTDSKGNKLTWNQLQFLGSTERQKDEERKTGSVSESWDELQKKYLQDFDTDETDYRKATYGLTGADEQDYIREVFTPGLSSRSFYGSAEYGQKFYDNSIKDAENEISSIDSQLKQLEKASPATIAAMNAQQQMDTVVALKAKKSKLKDQIKGWEDAKRNFTTSSQELAVAEKYNVGATRGSKIEKEAKERLVPFLGKGASYLNQEEYASRIQELDRQSRDVETHLESSYRNLLRGHDIRLEEDRKTGQLTFRDVSPQEKLYQVEGIDRPLSEKELQRLIKARQTGVISYEIPTGKESIDPALRRSRVRKVYYKTKEKLPEYKAEIVERESELKGLREQRLVSNKKYEKYLQDIQTKTDVAVKQYVQSGNTKINFDDSFGRELYEFGKKRTTESLQLETAETELDALKKNVAATEEELERLKEMKTKMGGDGMVGGGGRMVNPARIRIAQAKRGYGSAIMSQGERSARRRSGLSGGGGRNVRRQKRLEARGLVVSEQGRRPDRNKFAFDVLRSLEKERRRIIGQ